MVEKKEDCQPHHCAKVGVERHRKVVIDRKSDADTWKAIKEFRDGTCRNTEKSGCGVVIRLVDTERWVTISRIAVPLKIGTTMAAEMMGVCVLTGILDLVVHNGCVCRTSTVQKQ